jgi:purine-nucleoside/S-methyl-5'-thioadenosine phosphorylase / adenosine deaminase
VSTEPPQVARMSSSPPRGSGDELHQSSTVPAALGRPAELAPGVLFLFTGRGGGVSVAPYDTLNLGGAVGDDPAAVAENRRRLARACGLADGRVAWMRQVHGVAVRYADSGSGEFRAVGQAAVADAAEQPLPEADASLTDVPGLGLGVLVADCVPVLLADPEARIVGAAHAGREGMAAGVVTELLSAMSAAGADPARMHAVIGPHICGGCYEVPAEMRARIAEKVPESGCVTRKGTPGVDVGAGVGAQLARAGVATVASDPRCTAETASLYSYRGDGRTGRLAGLVWLAS